MPGGISAIAGLEARPRQSRGKQKRFPWRGRDQGRSVGTSREGVVRTRTTAAGRSARVEEAEWRASGGPQVAAGLIESGEGEGFRQRMILAALF